ncbi:MAG: metalloregulator ArsR/SmtB family transcription factor [Ignavibacteriales bacterium]|nr:metalloregulator ArsR/SmtB family transcription factor [Ignavibacteriales bacterium]
MAIHNHQAAIRTAKKGLAAELTIVEMAETFKVLGDQTRLKIVLALSKQELCVLDIATVVGMSESAVSHQLRLLKSLRLVKQRKDGKLVFYSLDDEHIEDLLRVASRHSEE